MSATATHLQKYFSGNRLYDAEVARLIVALDAMPPAFVQVLNVRKLYDSLDLAFSYITMIQIVKDYRKGLEVKDKMAGESKQTEEVGNQFVLERIAAIITKSYAHLGDAEQIATEDALVMIHRELKTYDVSLLTRNEKKRLPKQPPLS